MALPEQARRVLSSAQILAIEENLPETPIGMNYDVMNGWATLTLTTGRVRVSPEGRIMIGYASTVEEQVEQATALVQSIQDTATELEAMVRRMGQEQVER